MMQQADIKVSNQARKIIEILEKEDPEFMGKFVPWWIKNHMVIGGSHVLEYVEKVMK